MEFTRPKFVPEVLGPSVISPLAESDDSAWVQVLSAKCHFGLNVFLTTLKDLSNHPERNSTMILRAETVASTSKVPATTLFRAPDRFELESELHLQLLPKVPARDSKITQHCLFYRTAQQTGSDHDSQPQSQGLVVLIPDVKTRDEIPFYHPDVRKLAFHYEALSPAVEAAEVDEQAPVGVITIEVLPWAEKAAPGPFEGLQAPKKPARKRSPLAGPSVVPGSSTSSATRETPPPAAVVLDQADDVLGSLANLSHTSKESRSGIQPNESALPDRLYRTCLGLLDRLHKDGYGNSVGYKKRREHDVLVDKNTFQDLYLKLKERHKHLDSQPAKANKLLDTKRHVFKDVEETGIDDWSHWGKQDVALAAFLMLLWRDMYPAHVRESAKSGGTGETWDTWGRPSGGFIDLGCGNALLVHILLSEGYQGKGLELRSRKTWPLYPQSTQDYLFEMGINPPEWFPETLQQWEVGVWPGSDECPVREGTFMIGNHADEMTPWLPLLSLIPKSPVPFLSLPCCLHTLSGNFTNNLWTPPTGSPDLLTGLEDGESRYKAYIVWLSYCNWKAGWKVEREPLRVPSTRSWALIAREREPRDDFGKALRECREWALEQVNEVRQSGGFTVREKEGNQH